jgi:hypothetical protein
MLHDKSLLIPNLPMKFSITAFILFMFSSAFMQAQIVLPYAINKEGLPADTSKLAFSASEGGVTPGFFATCGIEQDEIAPDFVLYDTAGAPCRLSKLLTDGKPVLLIAASYTCPQSRKNIKDKLAILDGMFGKKVNIRLIYTIEAHPADPDICPYTGEPFITGANMREKVIFGQPTTYGQRKKMAKMLIDKLDIKVPVLIDSPDNAWWLTYGPAPNNAYLISPRGMVFRKYGWLENPNFANDVNILIQNRESMKTDIQNEIFIREEKENGHSVLCIKNNFDFTLNIVDASGKVVSSSEYTATHEIDLDKIDIAAGEYSIVIKGPAGQSFCLRYSRGKA